MRDHFVLWCGLCVFLGCSGSDGPSTPISDAGTDVAEEAADGQATDASTAVPDAASLGPLGYRPCDVADRVGAIEITLDTEFTSIQGQIYNGVVPAFVPMVAQTDGPCRLLRPRTLRCEPGCEVGTTCGEDGMCRPQPEAVSVGAITIEGLKASVEMMAGPPVFFYNHRGDLPHPAFEPSDAISFSAAGSPGVMAFELRGQGIEPVEIQAEALALEAGTSSTVRWTAPMTESAAMIHLVLSIANHGGTPGNIDCEVPDTGEFTIPLALTDALLNLGYSGFPALWLTRRTVDSTATALGCVQFVIQSNAALDISIPGLTSCSENIDCPEGQVCGPDLACTDGAPGER